MPPSILSLEADMYTCICLSVEQIPRPPTFAYIFFNIHSIDMILLMYFRISYVLLFHIEYALLYQILYLLNVFILSV